MLIQTRRLSSSAKSRLADLQHTLSNNVLSGYQHLKGSLIQAMAHRMNAKDKEEMIQYWGDEGSKLPITVPADPKKNRPESVRTLPTPNFAPAATEENTLYHPILGEKLADLGYKSLYLTNVRSLAMAPIWKKQRILRPERSQLIANDKIKNNLGSSLAGSISFFFDKKTKDIGIIDGQHRAGALLVLAQKGYWDDNARNIVVEVFTTSSQAQVGALFREINAAEPVRQVDLLMQEESPAADTETAAAVPTPMPTQVPLYDVIASPTTSPPSADSSTSSSTSKSTSASSSSTTARLEPTSAETASSDEGVGTAATATATRSTKKVSATGKNKKKVEVEVEVELCEAFVVEEELSQEQVVAILDEAADSLAGSLPEMFKPSSRCKPPHLNADVLRDDLFQSDFLPRHGVRCSADLLSLLGRVNLSLGAHYAAQQQQQAPVGLSKSMGTAVKKAMEYNFYLGLDKAWMYTTHTNHTKE